MIVRREKLPFWLPSVFYNSPYELLACSFVNFAYCLKWAIEFVHTEICGKKSLAIMMTCVSPAVVIFDFNPSYYERRCRWCRHRHTVTVVINEKKNYEFYTKRNRIAVEKAIQQKSLVFSPPVSATTTPTHTHTNTNTNTNTPETDFVSTSNEAPSQCVDHKIWRHVCGAQVFLRKEPTLNGTKAYAQQLLEFQFNRISFKISSFDYLYTISRAIR